MGQSFTSFVILGAMRTGSNYLESSLSEAAGITCYGELFNPEFLGRISAEDFFGYTKEERDADPLPLLDRMRTETGGLPGFRFFQEHDRRVLTVVLADPACAKIVLSRNPLHSFVSLGIARETGQWMLRTEKRRREVKIKFDPEEFDAYLKSHMGFYSEIRRSLQESGQTAFHLDYDELSDVAVLNGLLKWLGVDETLSGPSKRVKRQNELNVMDRVENPQDINPAIARLEFLDQRIRMNAERPPRNDIKSFVMGADVPLLFLPIPSRHGERVEHWMASLDGTSPDRLTRGLTAHGARIWCQANPSFRAFTVVSHPAERVHDIFVTQVLGGTSEFLEKLRHRLRTVRGLNLPETWPDPNYTRDRHRETFLEFLSYVRDNIGGRTSLAVEPLWATQATVLDALCSFKVPDAVIRADTLGEELAALAARMGYDAAPVPELAPVDGPALAEIYDDEVEQAVQAAYERDYAAFGFTEWGPTPP